MIPGTHRMGSPADVHRLSRKGNCLFLRQVSRSGRRLLLPATNLSRLRDFPGSLPSHIEALDTLYHERCPMRFSSYVYRQRSREMLSHFSRPLLYHRHCPMRFSSYVYRQRSREMLSHFSRPSLYHKREGNRPGGTAPVPGTYHIVCPQYKGPGHIIPFFRQKEQGASCQSFPVHSQRISADSHKGNPGMKGISG